MEEKDIDSYLKVVGDCIYNNPLPLLSIQNPKILKYIDNYLPYSIGMEFECEQSNVYNKSNFKNIPDILDVEVDSGEQRYRIPKGLKGMVCLWNICIQLKLNSICDLYSSNHYHFDFTDVDRDTIQTEENKRWVLKELESWGTALDLKQQNGWIRFFNCLGTLEIRIGEPTFDYKIIIKRLIQGSNISRKLKNEISPELLLSNINKELSLLKDYKQIVENDNLINKQIINSRIIKV